MRICFAAIPLAWFFRMGDAFVFCPSLTHVCYHSIPRATTNVIHGDESYLVEIPVLYESDRMLIINKPHGIAHHNNDTPEDGKEETAVEPSSLGIINLLRLQRRHRHHQEQHDGDGDDDGGAERLWGVHRLDRVTSGILILAKDPEMAQALTECFAKGTIQKVYVGISAKRPSKHKQGWVQGGMVRSRDKSWKLTRTAAAEAKTTNFAKTRFFTTPIQHKNHKFTLLLFRPYTGKTHQLRVAAKSLGLPLWGDPIYKDGSTSPRYSKSNTNSNGGGLTASDTRHENDTREFHSLPQRTYLHASGILIPPLLDNHPSVAVWCPPPFQDVFGENKDAITALMQKHCDVLEIVEAMQRTPL